MSGYQPKPRWTARQVNFLIENWDKMKDTDIASVLGKTLKSVRRKREQLELKKACGRGIVKRFEEKPAATQTQNTSAVQPEINSSN